MTCPFVLPPRPSLHGGYRLPGVLEWLLGIVERAAGMSTR